MKRSRYSKKDREAIIAEQTAGKSVDEICRHYQISSATFFNWKKELKEERDSEKRRIKELEQENERLKKMYAELSINHEILKEGYALTKKLVAQRNKKK